METHGSHMITPCCGRGVAVSPCCCKHVSVYLPYCLISLFLLFSFIVIKLFVVPYDFLGFGLGPRCVVVMTYHDICWPLYCYFMIIWCEQCVISLLFIVFKIYFYLWVTKINFEIKHFFPLHFFLVKFFFM